MADRKRAVQGHSENNNVAAQHKPRHLRRASTHELPARGRRKPAHHHGENTNVPGAGPAPAPAPAPAVLPPTVTEPQNDANA
jgi:hypothetical protein